MKRSKKELSELISVGFWTAIGLSPIIIAIMIVTGFGIKECDDCNKLFLGSGYSEPFQSSDYIMCKDCAEDYFYPFDIKQFKK